MTYGEIAAAAGSPRAYRAVGNILSLNYDPRIPCHRVVRSNGALGNYNRGPLEKARMLQKEGVLCRKHRGGYVKIRSRGTLFP